LPVLRLLTASHPVIVNSLAIAAMAVKHFERLSAGFVSDRAARATASKGDLRFQG
jgi:hypothetical protein